MSIFGSVVVGTGATVVAGAVVAGAGGGGGVVRGGGGGGRGGRGGRGRGWRARRWRGCGDRRRRWGSRCVVGAGGEEQDRCEDGGCVAAGAHVISISG